MEVKKSMIIVMKWSGGVATLVLVALLSDPVQRKEIFDVVCRAGNYFLKLITHEVAIWQVAVFLFVVVVVVVLILILTKSKIEENIVPVKIEPAKPIFLDYKSGIIDGVLWKWEWEKTYDGKWSMNDSLAAFCPNCKTPFIEGEGYDYDKYVCPHCRYSIETRRVNIDRVIAFFLSCLYKLKSPPVTYRDVTSEL
ncbi:hypothetical protein Barb6XT_03188 [Bacteroidales bacterium Barb6XT]|nr:hypothetical protein Barb6XT_03188 [Bacteroidales bacterium Barb6XT]